MSDPWPPRVAERAAGRSFKAKNLSLLGREKTHEEPGIIAKAMVLANDRLFIAGSRDVVDEKHMWGRSNEKVLQQGMREQAACLSAF